MGIYTQFRELLKKVPGLRKAVNYVKYFRGTAKREFLLEIMPKGSTCAEIGVWKGDFSEKILLTSRPSKLYLIDPWKFDDDETYKDSKFGKTFGQNQQKMDLVYESVLKRLDADIRAGRAVVIRETSEEGMKRIRDNSLDWIYIDGNHEYSHVLKDLALSLRKVKANGFITGDDYTEGGWWKGGVKKAVDEFLGNTESVRLVRIFGNQFVMRKLR